jgi:hypothetical protein
MRGHSALLWEFVESQLELVVAYVRKDRLLMIDFLAGDSVTG